MTTFVWFVSSMCSDVLLEMRQLSKLSLTDFTSVWLNAKMNTCVLRQVGAVREGFVARGTPVGFWFSHVYLCV